MDKQTILLCLSKSLCFSYTMFAGSHQREQASQKNSVFSTHSHIQKTTNTDTKDDETTRQPNRGVLQSENMLKGKRKEGLGLMKNKDNKRRRTAEKDALQGSD